MTHSAIYVPTKGRPELARKCVSIIHKRTGGACPVYVVSERDAGLYTTDILGMDATPFWLPLKGKGIGYSRNKIIEHADGKGYWSIMMVDDDQGISGDVPGLLQAAWREDIVGLGAYKSNYGLMCSGTEMARTYKEPAIWLTKGGVGYNAFALNVASIVAMGGFDPQLRCYEDTEIARLSMTLWGVPWMIYTGFGATDLKSNAQMRAMGSLAAQRIDRHSTIVEMHTLIYERWGERYISSPDKRFRCSWKSFITDYTDLSWPVENIRTDKPWDWQPKSER